LKAQLRLLLLLVAACGLYNRVGAQDLSNARSVAVAPGLDSLPLKLDSLSIIPCSVSVWWKGTLLADSLYTVDESASLFSLRPAARSLFTGSTDTLWVTFRVFPLSFTAPRFLRDRQLMERAPARNGDAYYVERPSDTNASLFGLEGLTRSGSISRGLTIGNNQDAVVNSSLNLQLSGRISGDIEVLAAITDENIPVQADGNTQQLQEFDRVYIQISDPDHKLIAGDYDVRNPDGYFLRYFKKAQGGLYRYSSALKREDKPEAQLSAGLGAAVSRGKFARNVFNGIESNQGPYRLRGAENELFIVVMSNSEKVFIDGQLLARGQDRDYTIDYNTAEITFTTRRLINKDLRIVVEFQYADRNYARTLLTGFAEYKDEKLQAGLNIYSEQDSKNQPLQQDLSPEDKALLASVGDSLSLALAPSGDSVPFNVNEILYARVDTVVNGVAYPSVFRYSTNPDSARFRVSFSNVGQGRGNYVAVDGAANGRVFAWVVPVNNVPQGSFEPSIQLISPKQRQMATAFVRYAAGKNTRFGFELAASRDDINRFSTLSKANDDGYAGRLTIDHSQPLRSGDKEGWQLLAALQTEVNDKDFRPVEIYRTVEFSRDWNTTSLSAFEREWLSNFQVGLKHSKTGEARYGIRSLLRGGGYKGFMHTLNGQLRPGQWGMKWDASLLTTGGGQVQSSFLRHRDEVTRTIGSWIPGIRFEQERNEKRLPGSDSLSREAFHFRIAEVFFTRPDTVKLMLKATAGRREDDGLSGTDFRKATYADMASVSMGWNGSAGQKLALTAGYRNLTVSDTTLTTVKPEESATGRVDYNLQTRDGLCSINAFYEAGTGREPRKTIAYVEVAPGTGNYSWNDYNDDGVPQLNEFETALFADQANYIRIFNNTDEYVKIFFNQINGVLNFNPGVKYTPASRPLWARFSLLSTVRYDNRFTAKGDVSDWNPLPGARPDTLLLSAQSNVRHTLFYDRTGSIFAADISWQEQAIRQLLANGNDLRNTRNMSGTIRWNAVRWLGIQEKVQQGTRLSSTGAFADRNYRIETFENELRLNLQPGNTYRLTTSWRYRDRVNRQEGGNGEAATINDLGLEWRYNSVKKGLLSARFNYVDIRYDAPTNTALAFEMLEGLKAGSNLTWGVSLQRNLGNSLQLSLNYEGRKPAATRIIHTGGAQVRAFF